jgi:transposase
MGNEDHGCLFVTKLPESYKACIQAIEYAVSADKWEVLGTLSEQPATPKRKPASYCCFETTVTLYGQTYRALVVHSDALDKRKTKKLAKALDSDLTELTKLKREQEKVGYACLPDAQAAVKRLPRGKFHRLEAQVHEEVRYGRGRPKANGAQTISGITYRLSIQIQPDEAAIQQAQLKAGCFVLLSNTLQEGPDAVSSRDLLFVYKDQGYVERNFGFLTPLKQKHSLYHEKHRGKGVIWSKLTSTPPNLSLCTSLVYRSRILYQESYPAEFLPVPPKLFQNHPPKSHRFQCRIHLTV